MGKKAVAGAGAVAVLMATWSPQQVYGAVSAVSAVKVAWTDATHSYIRVSWTESSPVANTIQLFPNGGNPRQLGTTTAAGPNELLVPVAAMDHDNAADDRSTVSVTDPTGSSASSPAFDRYLPYMYANGVWSGDGTVRWKLAGTPAPDVNPGDPLDVDVPVLFDVQLYEATPQETCVVTSVSDSTATEGPLPRRAKPYNVYVRTHNEWGSDLFLAGNKLSIGTTSLTVEAPASTPYKGLTTLTGDIFQRFVVQSINPPPCFPYDVKSQGLRLTVEARNTPTSPWYVVGYTRANAGRFTLSVQNPGGREYRLRNPDVPFLFGATTAPSRVAATTQLVSAKFIKPVISYGTKPQAYLRVDPAGSQRAALQFKNASGGWQGVTYKSLSSGRGIAVFNWNRRGTTQFRWWVPGSTTSTGLKIDPIYTAAFPLTVR